jgi:lipopolysaccharide transport system permease protein
MAAPLETEKITTVRHIRPGHTWLSLDVKEFWHARELLYFLTLRDIKVRYKQTAIGIVWLIFQPLLSTLLLTVIFSRFARFDTAPVPYAPFVMGGILIWLFVYTAITMTSTSFVNNAKLVTKIYFPRLIVPVSSTLACAFDLVMSLPILGVLMIFYGVAASWQLIFAPVFLIAAFILAAALGILFSAVTVRFRDVKYTLPFVLQILMLASPVFYPTSFIPEKWRLVFALNPLAGVIEGFRASVFGTPIDWPFTGISFVSIIVILAISLYIFRHMEDDFADLI